MWSFVLVLALAISPVALAVCQVTCAEQVAGHQHDADVPSCHESTQASEGVALKTDNTCRHSEGELVLAKALPAFELALAPLQSTSVAVQIGRLTYAFEATAISSASPPPLLLPLRI
jgi:hypothetical protein